MNAEQLRLIEDRDKKKNWRKFGPYLTERQWGTVREDYSPYGNAWEYISHDAARSKAYRWGEEGIGGVSDDCQLLNLAVAFWNKKDPILKERMFGLTGNEGNHAEDCKEHYYYLDSTPTHSYMKMLYKYPHQTFPYNAIVDENRKRGKLDSEFELLDTGVFNEDRYFDAFIEYAKVGTDDMLMKITLHNRGPEQASLHVLPHVWFRNTWSWGYDDYKPEMQLKEDGYITINHRDLGDYYFSAEGNATTLFCENETNTQRLYNSHTVGTCKDGINDFLIHGKNEAINSIPKGTKAAFNYDVNIPAGGSCVMRLRLSSRRLPEPFKDFEKIFSQRLQEADEFYKDLQKKIGDDDKKAIQRQAIAGMMWSKQFFYYDVAQWLKGDPGQPPPPSQRKSGRNQDWMHLNNADIISMPDKWEYPWYAAWDLAFHTIPIAMVDPEFAKHQLVLLTKE
jgi:hypothetical protein